MTDNINSATFCFLPHIKDALVQYIDKSTTRPWFRKPEPLASGILAMAIGGKLRAAFALLSMPATLSRGYGCIWQGLWCVHGVVPFAPGKLDGSVRSIFAIIGPAKTTSGGGDRWREG